MVTAEKIEDVLRGAIKKFSETQDAELDCRNTQLIICANDDEDAHPAYKIAYDYRVNGEVEFSDIYSGSFSGIVKSKAKSILSESLKELSRVYNCKPTEVKIMVLTQDKGAERLRYVIDVKPKDRQKHQQEKKLSEIIKV